MSTVIPIKGLFEAHIIVRDLQRSVAFYRDVLGLEVGIEQPERPTTFFWIGGRGKSMLGIFTSGSWPTQMMQHHLSFQVELEDLLAAPQRLRSAGITPKGHRTPSYPRGEPTNEPIVFAWMPAASIIFDDPDGNLLEYIAMPRSNSAKPSPTLHSGCKRNAGSSLLQTANATHSSRPPSTHGAMPWTSGYAPSSQGAPSRTSITAP